MRLVADVLSHNLQRVCHYHECSRVNTADKLLESGKLPERDHREEDLMDLTCVSPLACYNGYAPVDLLLNLPGNFPPMS